MKVGMLLGSLALTLTVSLFILVVFRARSRYTAAKAEARWGLAHGCQPPAKLDTGRWPLGLELIITAFKTATDQRLLRLFETIIEKTGTTFEQNLLGSRGIDTVDPENIEAILSKQFNDFGLGERRVVFFPLLGDGIFTQDGKSWEQSRALLRPAFQQNRDQIFTQVARASDSLIKLMPNGKPIDLQPFFFRFTLETTTFLLFGRNLDVLDGNAADSQNAESSFAAAFDQGQDYLARRGRLGGLYWLIDSLNFRRQCKIVHQYIDDAVLTALHAQATEDTKAAYTILGGLMKETRDPNVLRDQCLNVLLAGRDTTACLLSWTFRLLARHPQVQQKCRTDINDVCSRNPPNRTDLKRMRYLDAILKEVLRLYPSVPINMRTANRTTTLPTGGGPDGSAPVLIHKGEAVGYCPYIMHRRTDIFGADAQSFRPERWLENDGKLATTVGYGYLPFNAGPRLCLGQEFALLEAGYLIVRLLQTFQTLNLTPGDPDEEVGQERQKITLVISSADGCWVVLSRDAL